MKPSPGGPEWETPECGCGKDRWYMQQKESGPEHKCLGQGSLGLKLKCREESPFLKTPAGQGFLSVYLFP